MALAQLIQMSNNKIWALLQIHLLLSVWCLRHETNWLGCFIYGFTQAQHETEINPNQTQTKIFLKGTQNWSKNIWKRKIPTFGTLTLLVHFPWRPDSCSALQWTFAENWSSVQGIAMQCSGCSYFVCAVFQCRLSLVSSVQWTFCRELLSRLQCKFSAVQ